MTVLISTINMTFVELYVYSVSVYVLNTFFVILNNKYVM